MNRTAQPRIDTDGKKVYNVLMSTVEAAIDTVYRTDWSRIVAALIRLTGDFDVAEEAAQEAFAAAVHDWPNIGVPDSPRAWIIQAARHKAIDRIRRVKRASTRSSRNMSPPG